MIHDEGIEKAITWISGLDVTKDREVKMAIIGGLRELQTKRTEITTLHSAHEEDVKLIEKLEKALNTVQYFLRYEEVGHLDTVDDALSAITAWRGEK